MKSDSLLELYGGWAVVTGASDGLGREFADQLAARGFDLVLVARRHALLQEAADQLINTNGVRVKVIAADLATQAGVDRVVRETADIDVGVLVAAAGFGGSGALTKSDLRSEMDMVRVNCEAVLVMAHEFGARFQRRGRGCMVLMGSIVGFQGIAGAANYAATKAYVLALGQALQREMGHQGVDVLTLAPGPTNTGFGGRAGMDVSDGASAAEVVSAALRRLPRGGAMFPGPRAKLLGYGTQLLPRSLRSRLIGQAMAKMAARPTPASVSG